MAATPVGFAGMTHLGLNSAVASAALGVAVACYDSDPRHVAALAAGRPHVLEPGLEQLMAEHRERLAFSSDLAALAGCGLVYIAPDVPTDDQGNSDLSALRALIAQVDAALPAAIVLVLLSQVPPGFCRSLAMRPGRTLHYQVETLIFGQAVERALHPERFIIGCAEPSRPLPEVYRAYLERFGCPLLPMRFESAELAKISINCCLVAAIGVANTLAELCEHVGADWGEIVPALKQDKRIGPHAYLAPGLGIAGGNLERDLNTVVRLADQHGTDAGIVRAWIDNSRYRKNWVLRILHGEVFPRVAAPVIAVWGLAYKQDTDSTKNSAALELIRHLAGFRIRAFDPVVQAGDLAEQAASALEACAGADVLAIMTPWPEFARIGLPEVLARMQGRIIIDPYRVLRAAAGAEGLTYLTLGSPIGDHHAGT
jgi:UDPglucose 6-dehydrogenase